MSFSWNLLFFYLGFARVYGPNLDSVRQSLWEELAGLISWWLWCIGCDFNFTHFLSDRSGETHYSPTMMEYSKFTFEQGLIDLPLIGGSYTWSNNRDFHSWSRIDRFLVSPDWEAKYPNLLQKRLQGI